jgi:energy-coupling factor transporter ATP-binding protein EcfA2
VTAAVERLTLLVTRVSFQSMLATPPPSSAPPARPPIDARLLQWFAIELILDSRARLVEGGAGGDTRIDLADVFVDLPAKAWFGRNMSSNDCQVVWSICQVQVHGSRDNRRRELSRAVIIGGPGSGKSTATTMVAQFLRLQHVRDHVDEVPAHLQARVREVVGGLAALGARIKLTNCRDLLPLRINLPELSRWTASHHDDDLARLLWRFLWTRATEHAIAAGVALELSAIELEALIRAHHSVLWIFDGLDEVPRSAGRDRVVAMIRAAEPPNADQGIIVTTRPQGYEGELGELDALVLNEMPPTVALDYGQRLLRAWSDGEDPQLREKLHSLEEEFAKPEVRALVRTPLHTTMATLLVAEEGTLPNARHLLFEYYFDTIFKRELRKKGEHRIRPEDKALLKTLHARAGLALHTRSQERAGARPTLLSRELRAILETILQEQGRSTEDAQAIAERMLRFAADRLVLLLRITDGGYGFGIRSLQEFFAAIALLDGEIASVKRRLQAIALSPHWSNVLGFTVSALALQGTNASGRGAALEYTCGLCRMLNDGVLGGSSAQACFAGSRLAIAMLRETERYGAPWLHKPLWDIALEATAAPVQVCATRSARPPRAASTQWDDDLDVHVRLGALAADWSGDNRDTWLQRVLDAAQALLEGSSQRPTAGWRLLLVALQREEPRALSIAGDHAPQNAELARQMLEATLHEWGIIDAPWITAFVDGHASWFSPAWLMSKRPFGNGPWPASAVFSPWRLHWTGHLSWEHFSIGDGVEYMFLPLEGASSMWSEVTLPLASESLAWRAWRKLSDFHSAPSKDRLADALDAVAEWVLFDDGPPRWPATAWVIDSCLEFAASAEELRALATAARTGQLGDLEDWRAAEARWQASPSPSDKEITNWLSSRGLPWASDIGSRGRVLSLATSWKHDVGDATSSREVLRACAVLEADTQYRRRPLAWLHVMLSHCGDSPKVTGDLVPLSVVERAPTPPRGFPYGGLFAVDLLLPDLSGPNAEAWYRLLEARGRRGWNRSVHSADGRHRDRMTAILEALVARVSSHPDQWGLVDAIWATLYSLPSGSLAGFHCPPIPPDAEPVVQASAAALTLLAPRSTEIDVPAMLAALVSKDKGFDLREELANVLARRDSDRAGATELLLHMLDSTTANEEQLRDNILGGLFQHLKYSSPPVFATAGSWKEHGLPEPYLSGQAPEVLPPRIVRLAELSNIRLFKETPTVDAPFSADDPEQGQWIVVVGENGVGKTTLLRAIGLALTGPTVATRLLDESQPFVRNGGDGRIAIELDTGLVELVVTRDARTEMAVSAGDDKVTRPWVVGYGVRRGTARGEKDRAPEWGPTGELHTLFDRPATLVNAVDWLLDLDRRVLNERRQYGRERDDDGPRLHAATWQSVERALGALLEITALEPEDRHVMVTHPRLGRVRLDALSDGYLTTTGWVIDLIARWIQRQEDLRETMGGDVLREMTGVVLIDEIDLHLHPMWQMHIIDDVRRLFPRLSFVVTTHNPLTLHGARPGEIFIMRRGDGGRIELTQQDIRPGHDVDRVLFEQFGIRYTFDHETRKMLESHRALLERGVPAGDVDRVKLEGEIAARLGRVGEVLAEERGEEHGPPLPWSEEDRRRLNAYTSGKA